MLVCPTAADDIRCVISRQGGQNESDDFFPSLAPIGETACAKIRPLPEGEVMIAAQQQIYQQIQLLPLRERLELIRQLFVETTKSNEFQLTGSITVNGEIDEIIESQRTSVMAKLNEMGEQLRAELEK